MKKGLATSELWMTTMPGLAILTNGHRAMCICVHAHFRYPIPMGYW